MSKKIIFFDVDGTFVDVRPVKECIPESTIQAVHETRKKGNLCYLCTGRSLAEIYPYILDVGFDGIIGAGGGFVQMGDEMLYHQKVSDEDVHRVVDFFCEWMPRKDVTVFGVIFAVARHTVSAKSIAHKEKLAQPCLIYRWLWNSTA